MGTESSPTVSPDTTGAGPRPLWQVPVFLAGVTTLVVVLVTRAPADSGPRQVERQLNHARQILSHADGDAEAAAEAARRALEIIGPDGDRAGEAYFYLGSAEMRLGDHAPGDAARPHWEAARKALEEAERRGVPADEQSRLHWRLARVCFQTGDDPARVAQRLAASAEEAEDRVEAYDLLSKAYLRLTPPDYQKALDAISKLREQPVLQNDMLARVKLLSGELKLKLGRGEEARKDLEMILPAAPAEVISKARLLRARSYQDESKWAEAAAQWQEALKDSHEPAAERTEALYLFGICHRRLDQPEEAAKAWEECVRTGGTSAPAVAAAVQLADVRLDRKEYPEALDLLAGAVSRVHKPADWNNPYADVARVTDVFEKAAKTFREAGQFELALKLTSQFEPVAAPGRSAMLRAEITNEWALKKAEKAGGAATTPEDQQAKRDQLRQAAAALLEAATTVPDEAARANLLWNAGNRSLDGQDYTQAIATLDRFLRMEKRPERLGEGWYLLGEAYRQNKDLANAEQAYLNCLNYSTTFAYHARYQLAILNWEAGRTDKAVDILQENLKQLRTDPEPEAREKSLYALGKIAYQRRDYRAVVQCLEEALQAHAGPDQARARYQLADSYRQLATEAKRDEMLGDSPNPEYKKHLAENYKHNLEKAAEEYQELMDLLEKPDQAGSLTPAERAVIPFTAADCLYNLGQYPEALALYEKLIEAKSSDKAVLSALGYAARCHSAMGQQDKFRQRLEDIHKALAGQDESVRQQWDEWLSLVSRPTPQQ